MKKTIVYTGLLVGTLDAVGAILNFLITGGKDPMIIFKFIASGVFGREALSGGIEMIICGFVFHYFIATCWTAVYFYLIPRIKAGFNGKIISGIVYGVIVWSIMNLVVLPLSNTPKMKFAFSKAAIGLSIIIICVGLPISILVSRYYSKTDKA